MQLTVSFDLDEVPEVLDVLARLPQEGQAVSGDLPSAATATATEALDVVRLYDQMAENESPRLLEALTSEPLTFEELASRMVAAGSPLHSVASMRAIYRNVKRREKRLIEASVLKGPVVRADFDGYEKDGAGRYFLEAADAQALATHVA